MIDTSKLTAIKEAQEGQAPVQLSDLVLIGNILKSGEIDTTVVSDYNTYIEVNGLINTVNFLGRYVVVGREIVKITSVTQLTTTSKIFVDAVLRYMKFMKDSNYDGIQRLSRFILYTNENKEKTMKIVDYLIEKENEHQEDYY